MADWRYDDLRQVGLGFEDAAAVETYDRNQRTSAAEDRALLDQLAVGADRVVIDIGCGTGVFAIEAARRCRSVYAVDVSAGMLAFSRAVGRRARTSAICSSGAAASSAMCMRRRRRISSSPNTPSIICRTFGRACRSCA